MLHNPLGSVATYLESACLLGKLQQTAETELVSFSFSSDEPVLLCMSNSLQSEPPLMSALAGLATQTSELVLEEPGSLNPHWRDLLSSQSMGIVPKVPMQRLYLSFSSSDDDPQLS
jgi:hypothetical protein